MTASAIVRRLRRLANPAAVRGMARYGINPSGTLGVPIPALRAIARETGRDHGLALELWATNIHEARILASMVACPEETTSALMDRWAGTLDSWDVCDQVCANLFERTRLAYQKAEFWSRVRHEFVKRAGFTLMARLAVSDKSAPDRRFIRFLSRVNGEAHDERNYVRKSVNWALRQIGKRNIALHTRAVKLAKTLAESTDSSSRWVGRDALRELTAPATVVRITGRSPV